MKISRSKYNVPELRTSERTLLHLLRLKGAMSKAELARLSDMSAQGVSIIVERLLDLGLVCKGNKQRGRVGQPSTPIELAPEGAISLGIFVGNDTAQLILVDFSGNTILERHVTYDQPLSEEAFQTVIDGAEAITGRIEENLWGRRIGIGISARTSLLPHLSDDPGSKKGGVDAEIGSGTARPLASRLKERFDLPVHCVNDIRAACLAQIASSRDADVTTALYLNIGDTLGSGLILEGRLVGAENELSSNLHAMPVFGRQGARIGDFASFKAMRRRMEDAGFDFHEQVACDFADTRTIFEEWKGEAVPALAMAIRAAAATVPVERVLIASRLGDDDLSMLVSELRFAVETDTCASTRIPEISGCTIGPGARAWGTAIVPFFKAFGPSEKTVTASVRRSAVA